MNLKRHLSNLFKEKKESSMKEKEFGIIGIKGKDLKQIADNVGNDWITAPYYKQAEEESMVRIFWDPNNVFRKMFDHLDSTIILEPCRED